MTSSRDRIRTLESEAEVRCGELSGSEQRLAESRAQCAELEENVEKLKKEKLVMEESMTSLKSELKAREKTIEAKQDEINDKNDEVYFLLNFFQALTKKYKFITNITVLEKGKEGR